AGRAWKRPALLQRFFSKICKPLLLRIAMIGKEKRKLSWNRAILELHRIVFEEIQPDLIARLLGCADPAKAFLKRPLKRRLIERGRTVCQELDRICGAIRVNPIHRLALQTDCPIRAASAGAIAPI